LKKELATYYQDKPFHVIIWIGLFFRLLAAFLAKGYGWHDDQFLIIEIAQSWVDGVDFYGWLPTADGNNIPEGFSFFYVGLHYLLFLFTDSVGITNPEFKMLITRLLHAFWSIPIIYFGYKTTLELSNKSVAIRVGWLLSIFWIYPFIAVRNLVEYTSIPFLMMGLWMVVVARKNDKPFFWWMAAGLIFGMAFNVRFQTLIIPGGIGLALLYEKRWKQTFFLALGTLISMVVIQGSIDFFVWGTPFVQFIEYVNYNMHHAANYVVSPWYTYLLFLSGILIPPVSLFILAGYFKTWKQLLILFIPILIFLVFHSYYPNKQERFVVTIMPFLMMSGIIGWMQWEETWKNSKKIKQWIKGAWIFFWVVNFIALIPVTVMYSKKARVESMVYLSRYDNIQHFLIEDVHQSVLRFPPQYYLKHWIRYDTFMREDTLSSYKQRVETGAHVPDFILFYQPDNLQSRVDSMLTIFPDLVYETTIEPGFMDKVLFWLNPINDNQIITIYRNKATISNAIPD
jgi:hypothetical protein